MIPSPACPSPGWYWPGRLLMLWADHQRRCFDARLIDKDSSEVSEALAHRCDADYLPGWCGPED
jgi:hypothetical protein